MIDASCMGVLFKAVISCLGGCMRDAEISDALQWVR
jgi:hypothetical protein